MVEQGAQLVELRLDYINGEVNLKRLLNNRPSPVIITCRLESDGGKWKGDEETRLMLLRTAIAEGVEYVDLEESIAGTVRRYGPTKRIVSMHDFSKTPDNLEAIHARLAALDADIVKLSTMANSPHDNLRMLQMIDKSDVPTVGMCMGEIGTPSRILAAKFGAPFTFSTFHHERALAPGQLSYRQMADNYRFDSIGKETKVFGVIADPIAHSLSPIIHNAAFAADEMNCVYVPFRIPAEHLEQFIIDCKPLGVCGLSVTIPHKEAVLQFCTKVDGAAQAIGAANTLVFQGAETLGFNTDYRAAMSSLDRVLPDSPAAKPLSGRTALILGAGGAARAVAFGLKRRGANVVVASRTFVKAERLANWLGGRAVDWDHRHSPKADVLVNATPIGMHPNVDESPYDMHYLRPTNIVFDTVYNPEQTLLIKEARQRNCKVISGVDMFIGQAALQYAHFTQRQAPTEVMRQHFKRAIGPAKY